MQLEHIDMIALQPLQARLERGRDRRADVGRSAGTRTLVREDDVRLELREHAADVRLRGAVAVGGGGVEVIDAGLDRARDRALLIRGRAFGHQPADRAAAEGEHRNVKAGAAEFSFFHAATLPGTWPARQAFFKVQNPMPIDPGHTA